VGERGDAISRIAGSGTASLRALARRDAELSATLRELPATLTRVRSTSRTLGDVSDVAAPVVAALASATTRLRPAVAQLPATARGGRQVMALATRRRARDAFRAINGAGTLDGTFSTVGAPLRTTLCELDPMLRYIEPYKTDFLQIAFHLSSGSHAYDATSHTVRLAPIVNENSLSGAPDAALDSSRLLLQSGLFTGTVKKINYDPYIKPGGIGKTTSLNSGGTVSGPASLRDSGWTYARVRADC
jgi:ABC-type transporter Mla subunit MlaD